MIFAFFIALLVIGIICAIYQQKLKDVSGELAAARRQLTIERDKNVLLTCERENMSEDLMHASNRITILTSEKLALEKEIKSAKRKTAKR